MKATASSDQVGVCCVLLKAKGVFLKHISPVPTQTSDCLFVAGSELRLALA